MKKNIIIICILVAAVIAVGITGFFIYRNNRIYNYTPDELMQYIDEEYFDNTLDYEVGNYIFNDSDDNYIVIYDDSVYICIDNAYKWFDFNKSFENNYEALNKFRDAAKEFNIYVVYKDYDKDIIISAPGIVNEDNVEKLNEFKDKYPDGCIFYDYTYVESSYKDFVKTIKQNIN